MTTLRIARRFTGPVSSGNGGYSAGLVARLFPPDAAVEVTIRAPIPLETTLRAHETADGIDIMTDDAATRILILSARETDLAPPTIRALTLEAARRASAKTGDQDDHVLPNCFVCGPGRAHGDGLRIFSDWVDPADNPNDFPIVAAPWTPDASLADADGRVAVEFIWAAIDCPGAFAVDSEPILLGRMTARVLHRPQPGEKLIVAAWNKGAERRKRFAGVALFAEDGRLLAHCEQTWIQIDRHADT